MMIPCLLNIASIASSFGGNHVERSASLLVNESRFGGCSKNDVNTPTTARMSLWCFFVDDDDDVVVIFRLLLTLGS